ncbi:MAG TPA: bifunctional riboflavin kinase/FAD synthetase [Rhodospirillales bacterium]|jgi:riboflavin kinase/FMN adenylyltransferase|nr:bifunctional riboflavin kinase/FAD synthetase [Pseudomonadota bacterium]HIM43278.1 bifunctional riboflavin kinase/FAD synthetase [Rhodospirillales bacterium]
MRIYRHYDALPADARGAAVAIGNFDGVHPGHQTVIHEAGLIAGDMCRPWAVLTFEPHPRAFFTPGSEPFRLTPFRSKARRIAELGADLLIVQRFDKAFSSLPAEDFVNTVLVDGLGAGHVVSGYDFVFGHKRGGNCELLLAMGAKKGFGFTAVNAQTDSSGEAYSSTRVRERLGDADPRGAAAILGRDFEIEGRVARGEARGKSIGFPTANIPLGAYLRPALGVYAVRAAIEQENGEIWLDGVANIGVRPTFGSDGVVLEVFLFDFDDDLYGKRLRVRLVDFLRPEKKFDGVDDLKAQIAQDSAKAQKILQ